MGDIRVLAIAEFIVSVCQLKILARVLLVVTVTILGGVSYPASFQKISRKFVKMFSEPTVRDACRFEYIILK